MPKKAAKPRKAKAKPHKRAVAHINQNGDGLMDILSGVNKFLKQSKLISTLAPVLGSLIPGVGTVAGPAVGGVASALGYGKRKKAAPKKRKMGRGLNPSGMGMCHGGKGLSLAGQHIPYR